MEDSAAMIFAITLISLLVLSSIVGITFGIYGYISAKLWELSAKKLSYNDWEDAWANHEIKKHYRYIGFKKYGIWDSETDKWYGSIHFQFLKWYDKELFRWNIKKGLW